MKSAILALLAATIITISAAPSFAYNDRNNEPACAQIGTVDPRCF